jgi:bifunctional UDP-N-acetylglucosamine pyrophosphorylase/glucosamine-1-phosphate N-acetyltransferase
MPETISALILAAGLGTRMKSKIAKVLHRAGGDTLLEHVADAALAVAPPERIVAVVGYQAEQVQAAVESKGIRFATQTKQKGTGHAVLSCKGMPGLGAGRVLILYGDCPLLRAETLRLLLARHDAAGVAATVITTHVADPTGYGRILIDDEGYLAAIVEEKAATTEQRSIREINSGIYCIEASLLWKHLPHLKPNPASGEIYLTDIVEELRSARHKVARFVVQDAAEILGINNRVELAEADRILRERSTRELMLDGVTLEKPETVTVDRRVKVGADTVIEAFAQLLGTTVIGEGCRVGACSIVKDSVLEDGAQVGAFTVIDASRLASGAKAGPFSRIRMGAQLETGAIVGNFVELKKTRLGAGSKSQHLAYLGDSEIGAKANIGAGTITCNYDGTAKHPTKIGDGAFIGSNSTLVAPVEIGADSYVAAGSVITEAVPDGALGLGRARQLNKEGWVAQKRAKKKK